ncbi:glycosyltransferase family 4 protein [Bacillus sp. FJAT-42315]|uniref:glycosyltransferase family 4 protein n=1 Tax=Bacillus sp. FJAT-42315 TaxID=2014077 RepID=UPI000C246A66|nr:glycosyltransferase family 4 protein [Bacillus sp. FJAT-42315]
MNVLFLTLSSMESVSERGIYTDLVRELAYRGVHMYVVTPREKRKNLPTELVREDYIYLLKVKTGNITKTNLIEKGLSTLSIERQYLQAIQEHFGNIEFDLVMYSTPPITFEKVVRYFKGHHQSKTYLLLKDIFPQNAVDIELMQKGGLMWRYFRNKEKKLYELSDHIGCMSPANVDYIARYNNIDKKKLEIFPNCIDPINRIVRKTKHSHLLEKYQIPQHSTLFIYGGNLGKPQGINFLLEVAAHFDAGHLIIVGSGTEYEKVRAALKVLNNPNVTLLPYLPKEEYDQLLQITDVGLIFLDNRFTIPNFPSRVLSYMEYSLPILAATDRQTDLKDVLIESNSGFWCESGDLESFMMYAARLAMNKRLREEMGGNGRLYLEQHYDVRKAADILLKHLLAGVR